MTRARLTLLKGDRRTAEFRDWNPWLEALAEIAGRFDDELDDDPLSYNETASVSLLAAAAGRVGYLGIAEFSVVKGHSTDRRRPANGRCDFWMSAVSKTYGFEFKQSRPKRMTDALWMKSMAAAKDCAKCLRPAEADERVAGLIVSLWNHKDDDVERAREGLHWMAQCCDYAWELRGSGEAKDTFLFFDLI